MIRTRLGNLLVPSATQRAVKLSDVAQLTLEYAPANIQRYNRQRQITIVRRPRRYSARRGRSARYAKVGRIEHETGLHLVFSGGARQLSDASNDFGLAVLLAIVFIYMVLASQFNSFIHPLTIMTSLPLSLPAGLFALMAFGMTINVYSAIGMLMLFGIVKKNSILQVDYTNTLESAGHGAA